MLAVLGILLPYTIQAFAVVLRHAVGNPFGQVAMLAIGVGIIPAALLAGGPAGAVAASVRGFLFCLAVAAPADVGVGRKPLPIAPVVVVEVVIAVGFAAAFADGQLPAGGLAAVVILVLEGSLSKAVEAVAVVLCGGVVFPFAHVIMGIRVCRADPVNMATNAALGGNDTRRCTFVRCAGDHRTPHSRLAAVTAGHMTHGCTVPASKGEPKRTGFAAHETVVVRGAFRQRGGRCQQEQQGRQQGKDQFLLHRGTFLHQNQALKSNKQTGLRYDRASAFRSASWKHTPIRSPDSCRTRCVQDPQSP